MTDLLWSLEELLNFCFDPATNRLKLGFGAAPTPIGGGAPLQFTAVEVLNRVFDSTNNQLNTGPGVLTDDVALGIGTGSPASFLWETADANANAMIFALPNGGAVDVPVVIFGDQSILNTDLGWFNGVVEPTVVMVNAAGDAYVSLDAGDDNVASAKGLYFKSAADEDVEIINLSVTGTPRIYWDESQDCIASTRKLAVELGLWMYDDKTAVMGTGSDSSFYYNTADANANCLTLTIRENSANDIGVLPIIKFDPGTIDFGLFDGVTQPAVAAIEKNNKYTSSSTGTAAGAGAILVETGKFTNSVVGDIIRITAGTNCTAGWYWITTVTDADTVVLDRSAFTGVTSNCTYVGYHSFTMLSADGLCTRITDGAPTDSSIEVDRDGWIILDVGQTNGRLYWRANNGWHYVDATAGVSLPSSERTDRNGHRFEIGDEVKLVVDRVNDDGSFHALPVFV